MRFDPSGAPPAARPDTGGAVFFVWNHPRRAGKRAAIRAVYTIVLCVFWKNSDVVERMICRGGAGEKESKGLLIFYRMGTKKWQAIHIAPLQPSYPCCVPTLGDWTGAGRVGLAGTNVRIFSIIHRIFFAFCRSLSRFFSGKVVPLVKEKPEGNRYESDTQRSGHFSRH